MTPSSTRDLFTRLETFYDAAPRDRARVELHGSLVLFVAHGLGVTFYARPTLGADAPPSPAVVEAVRARQRDLGLPEAFEWVHETTPALLHIMEAAGFSVLRALLMVLDPAALPHRIEPAGATVRLLDPASPRFAADLAARRAVTQLGFGAPGTHAGAVGPRDRDAIFSTLDPSEVAREAERVAVGRAAYAVAETTHEGALSSGAFQHVGGVAEIVGVATLPAARRRGLGAAVTHALARAALDTGADLVFISAMSDDVARVYEKLGFARVGTACIAEKKL